MLEQRPIIYAIFACLNKDDIFNFLITCKKYHQFIDYIYSTFTFRYSSIEHTNTTFKSKIVKLNYDIGSEQNLMEFTNLKKIYITHNFFNSLLAFIPKTIEHIKITNILFNKPVNDNFHNLKKLCIKGLSFNSEIDSELIDKLECLKIDSPTYFLREKINGLNNKNIIIKTCMYEMNVYNEMISNLE